MADTFYPIRLLIAGSRTLKDYRLFETYLIPILQQLEPEGEVELVSGMASKGPDRMGADFAHDHGYPLKEFPADWNKLGKAAGMIRNAQMAEYVTHALIFWDGESTGTANMLDLCKKKAIPYTLVMFDREALCPPPPFEPAFSAIYKEGDIARKGNNIFREEAWWFSQQLGLREFPLDHTTIPWERIEPALQRIAMSDALDRFPYDAQALEGFLNLVGEHQLWVTAHRLEEPEPVPYADPNDPGSKIAGH